MDTQLPPQNPIPNVPQSVPPPFTPPVQPQPITPPSPIQPIPKRTTNFAILVLIPVIILLLTATYAAYSYYLKSKNPVPITPLPQKNIGRELSPSPTTTNNFTCKPLKEFPSYLTYTNTQKGFCLQYPGDWKITEDSYGLSVMFSPPGLTASSVNIKTQDSTSGITLEENVDTFYKSKQEEFDKMTDGPKLEVVNKEKTSLGGNEAYKVTVKVTYGGAAKGMTEQGLTFFAIKGDKLYLIGYSSAYENNDALQAFQNIIDSFSF